MRLFILIICLLFLLNSCEKSKKLDTSRIPFLEVENEYLYLDEIQSIIPKDISSEDSLMIVNDYVHKWITDVLLYKHAQSNISNQEEIEELTETYRKSLIIHQYQQNILQERLDKDLLEEDMRNFYDENKEKFRLKTCVIKGVFVKVPFGAPNYNFLQKNLQNFNDKSIENIEKYSIQNATDYEYFGDRWTYSSDMLKKMPLQIENIADFICSNRYIEVQDSSYHYLLRVLESKTPDDIEPYEMAKDKIYTILSNMQKTSFIRDFETKLYDEAKRKNDIKYFEIKEDILE